MDNCIHIGKVTIGPLNWILLNNRFTKFIFLANHCRTMKVQSLLKNNLTLKKSSMAQHHAHEGCTHRLFLIWNWKACMSVSWHLEKFSFITKCNFGSYLTFCHVLHLRSINFPMNRLFCPYDPHHSSPSAPPSSRHRWLMVKTSSTWLMC
jgi:hypothetical protein